MEGEKVFGLNFASEEKLTAERRADFDEAKFAFQKVIFLSEDARTNLALNEIVKFEDIRKFKPFVKFIDVLIEVS